MQYDHWVSIKVLCHQPRQLLTILILYAYRSNTPGCSCRVCTSRCRCKTPLKHSWLQLQSMHTSLPLQDASLQFRCQHLIYTTWLATNVQQWTQSCVFSAKYSAEMFSRTYIPVYSRSPIDQNKTHAVKDFVVLLDPFVSSCFVYCLLISISIMFHYFGFIFVYFIFV